MTASNLLRSIVAVVVLSRGANAQDTLSAGKVAAPAPRGSVELVTVNGELADRWRHDQLKGVSSSAGYLLRSTGSLTMKSPSSGVRRIPPELRTVYNSALPFSMNEGGAWAGRGTAWLFTTGVDAQLGRVRLLLAPQISYSTNSYWLVRDTSHFPPPPLPPDRNGRGYMFPWYDAPYSIDLPLRYGNEGLTRIGVGQSSLTVDATALTVGLSSENEWWGPGARNAMILSNNAPGFPHLFLRSRRPLETRAGRIEFRWLSGALYESDWFDSDPDNDVRSIAAVAATISPRRAPGLTFGFARSVYGTTSGSGAAFARFFDVFRNTGHPNDKPLADSTLTPGGVDQVYSLFGRWVMPESGLETYAEFGRTEFPRSLRDLLVYPTHTMGYTIGLQWDKPAGNSRIGAEVTTLEQSSSFRDRPIGSWYTSRRVIQGYTNHGQALGAAIGPGSSSQWIGYDFAPPSWRAGLYAGRIRWNEDMRSVYNWPKYQEFCNHDVSTFLGMRAGAHTRFGFISADWTLANRINAFFQVQSGCPSGNSQKDIRNKTLSVTFAPFSR